MALEAAHDGSFDVSNERSSSSASDTHHEAERLREKGNAAFQAKSFELACSLYSQALEHGSDNHVLWSNRSAALHALKQFDRALEDAKRAVELAPQWPKSHLRYAAALEGLQQWQLAADAYSHALTLTPASDATQTRKLTYKRTQLQTRIKQLPTSAKASSKASAVSRGFLSAATTSIYDEKDDIVRLVVDRATNMQRVEAPVERSWRKMLERLKQGCSSSTRGLNANGERVVLDDGVFAKLLDPQAFQALVYPGIPPAQLQYAPQSLQTLLADPWYEIELLALMPVVHKKAESVLANVKVRGATQGDTMDAATERMLWPQILQEAFGREVLVMVHRVNAKKHVLLANDARTLADPTDERGSWNQLPSTFLDALMQSNAATLDGFMGDDWRALLLADVERMAANGMLLATTPHGATTRSVLDSTTGRMRFVESSECEQSFPALAELLTKLHALPFEINRKRPAHAALCAQFAHSTAVQHLRAGEAQPLRLDCGVGEHDNGFKLTCMYFFNGSCEDSNRNCNSEPDDAELQLRTSARADAPVQRIRVCADRLVVFQSQHVLNALTAPRVGQELFYISFWVHGQQQ